MIVIKANNVNEALASGLRLVLDHGVARTSRNGPVLAAPEPVTTVYANPCARVLVNSVRRANPFFHLFEALWMLAGRDDVAFVMRYVKRMIEYSDDGIHLNGAYGHRWRSHFDSDQIHVLVNHLHKNPSSRRAVLAMYDPNTDLDCIEDGKDVPCNTHIYFDARDGRLNMTVCCRSNDLLWGAFGANVVHMSILHEYMALSLALPVGVYRQVSNDLHLYTDVLPLERVSEMEAACYNEGVYTDWVRMVPLFPSVPGTAEASMRMRLEFDHENRRMLNVAVGSEAWEGNFNLPFFRMVAVPMHNSWRAYRAGDIVEANRRAMEIVADDWRVACLSWLNTGKKELV